MDTTTTTNRQLILSLLRALHGQTIILQWRGRQEMCEVCMGRNNFDVLYPSGGNNIMETDKVRHIDVPMEGYPVVYTDQI